MGDKGVHAFAKGINLKVNVITRLEFEFTFYDTTFHLVSYNITGVWLKQKFIC